MEQTFIDKRHQNPGRDLVECVGWLVMPKVTESFPALSSQTRKVSKVEAGCRGDKKIGDGNLLRDTGRNG